MTIKSGFFDLFGIPYYDFRLYSQRQRIKRVIVKNSGQETIKIKGIGLFTTPKDYKHILKNRIATEIFADIDNAQICNIDVNEGNEEQIEEQYNFKNYYNIIHNSIAPKVLQEITENDAVADVLSHEKSFWEQLGTPIIIASILLFFMVLILSM